MPAALSDVGEEYYEQLQTLTCNSKPLIDSLTTIARENLDCCAEIARLIEQRITSAPYENKLVAMYLLDSVAKKVGGAYLSIFAQSISTTFLRMFQDGDNSLRQKLVKLLRTWPSVFREKYHEMEAGVRTLMNREAAAGKGGGSTWNSSNIWGSAVAGKGSAIAAGKGSAIAAAKGGKGGGLSLSSILKPHMLETSKSGQRILTLEGMTAIQKLMLQPGAIQTLQKSPQVLKELQTMLKRTQDTRLLQKQEQERVRARQKQQQAQAQLLAQATQLVNSLTKGKGKGGKGAGGGKGAAKGGAEPVQEEVADPEAASPEAADPEVPPEEEWDLAKLSIRDESVIKSLYDPDMPQCPTDGLRLTDQAALTEHMDQLFQENKREREAVGKAGASRQWFSTKSNWIQEFGEGKEQNATAASTFFDLEGEEEQKEEASEVSYVKADDEQECCPLCGERFTLYFEQTEEEWMYENAIQAQVQELGSAVPETRIVHLSCHVPGTVPMVGRLRSEASLTPTPTPRAGGNSLSPRPSPRLLPAAEPAEETAEPAEETTMDTAEVAVEEAAEPVVQAEVLKTELEQGSEAAASPSADKAEESTAVMTGVEAGEEASAEGSAEGSATKTAPQAMEMDSQEPQATSADGDHPPVQVKTEPNGSTEPATPSLCGDSAKLKRSAPDADNSPAETLPPEKKIKVEPGTEEKEKEEACSAKPVVVKQEPPE